MSERFSYINDNIRFILSNMNDAITAVLFTDQHLYVLNQQRLSVKQLKALNSVLPILTVHLAVLT